MPHTLAYKVLFQKVSELRLMDFTNLRFALIAVH